MKSQFIYIRIRNALLRPIPHLTNPRANPGPKKKPLKGFWGARDQVQMTNLVPDIGHLWRPSSDMLEQPLTGSSRSPSSSAILLVEGMCTLTRWAQHRLTGIPYMAPWQNIYLATSGSGWSVSQVQQRHHQIRKSLGVVRPGIYEFEPLNNPVLRSKISERKTHSVTTLGFLSSSETFGRYIKLREGHACGVTRMPVHLDKLLCLISSWRGWVELVLQMS